MKSSRAVTCLGALAGVLLSGPAFAEISDATAEGKNYDYIFTDDALNADTSDGTTPRIVVVKSAQRARLLHPRVNFVPKLLKTVENM